MQYLGMPKYLVRACLLAVTAMLALTACGRAPKPAAASPEERPRVLTTFTVLADMADTIGGGHVVVESITKVGAEIHGYQPTPSDLIRAQDADLILDNGLGLERWFERFLHAVPAPHVVLSEGVEPVNIRSGNYEGKPNPHAWMSPKAAKVYVDNIVAAFSDLLPEHAGDFRRNGTDYKQRLDTLMADLQDAFADPAAVPALVSCEGAFSYLVRDAGLREAYLWPVNSDAEGTPRQIKDVIAQVRQHRIPSVFCESTVNPESMQQVAAATGARLITPLYVDSLSGPEGPVPTHLELIQHDISLITKGLAP
jgi:manganese transport system substrate-binding protein